MKLTQTKNFVSVDQARETIPFSVARTYADLRQQVKETLLLGQRRIEQARVQTYWKTGQLIHEHILAHDSRSEHYGEQVIRRLAEDLEVGPRLLWRCLHFARSFANIIFTPHEGAGQKIVSRGTLSLPADLAWSHFRALATVRDEETRLSLMQRAAQKGWSAKELAEKIRLETGGDGFRRPQAASADRAAASAATPARTPARLIPKRGQLYTYRLIAPAPAPGPGQAEEDQRPWIDLGFQVHRQLPDTANRLKPDDIIESVWQDAANGNRGDYAAVRSTRGEGDLFTYRAVVERVVDGDTLRVRIDLGFETRVRQYLRLRGIDTPEMATEEGKRAKRFVERELSAADSIILTSSRADKYDRYLADVYYQKVTKSQGHTSHGALGAKAGDLIYLNQKLLDEGLAGRMG